MDDSLKHLEPLNTQIKFIQLARSVPSQTNEEDNEFIKRTEEKLDELKKTGIRMTASEFLKELKTW